MGSVDVNINGIIIPLKTENEKLLFGHIKTLIDSNEKFSSELEKLKVEFNGIKNKNSTKKSVSESDSEFATDSDELEQDTCPRTTNWIVIQNNKAKRASKKAKSEKQAIENNHTKSEFQTANTAKKRKASTSPLIDKEAATCSGNPVALTAVKKITTTPSPPPINIIGITTYGEIKELLKENKNNYKITSLNNNVWKINMPDIESYRNLSAKLNQSGIQWFTFENKIERTLKVMARGIHSSVEKSEIIADLKLKGFKVLDAVNILKKDRNINKKGEREYIKRPLPLFMLTFEHSESIDKIFALNGICNMTVKIEHLRRGKGVITQCKKCQAYNHTQTYCMCEARCVKCAGKHMTNQCNIGKDVPPKCVNCLENHPANYRGCEVAKQLQKIRNSKETGKNKNKSQETALIREGVTFAQSLKPISKAPSSNIYKNNNNPSTTNPGTNSVTPIQALNAMQATLEKICQRLGKIEENIESLNQNREKQELENAQFKISMEKIQKNFENIDNRFSKVNLILNNKKDAKR